MSAATAPVVDAIPVWRHGNTTWLLHKVHGFSAAPSGDLYADATWRVVADGRLKRFTVNVHEVDCNAIEVAP